VPVLHAPPVVVQINSWVEKEVEDKKTGATRLQWVMVNTDDHLRACEEINVVLAAVSNLFPSVLADTKTRTAEKEK